MSLELIVDPNYAILLLLMGILLLYAEFNKPGTVVFGCAGALAVMLASYGLSHLPLRPSAFVALGAGVGLVVLGVKFPLRGLAPYLGATLLIFGLGSLVKQPPVSKLVAVGAAVIFTAVTTWLLRVASLARRNKGLTGPHTMIGKLATVRTPLTPAGQVEIRGELWQAVLTDSAFAARGASVVVRDIQDLQLSVVALQTTVPSVQRE